MDRIISLDSHSQQFNISNENKYKSIFNICLYGNLELLKYINTRYHKIIINFQNDGGSIVKNAIIHGGFSNIIIYLLNNNFRLLPSDSIEELYVSQNFEAIKVFLLESKELYFNIDLFFIYACMYGAPIYLINIIISKDNSVIYRKSFLGMNGFMIAARHGWLHIVEYLKNYYDIIFNELDNYGRNAFLHALSQHCELYICEPNGKKQYEIALLLFDISNVLIRDKKKLFALFLIAKKGGNNKDIINLLIDKLLYVGENINSFINISTYHDCHLKQTPLIIAIQHKNWEIVCKLISCNANKYFIDNCGKTAYDLLLEFRDKVPQEIIQLLKP